MPTQKKIVVLKSTPLIIFCRHYRIVGFALFVGIIIKYLLNICWDRQIIKKIG